MKKEFSFSYQHISNFDSLPTTYQKTVNACREAKSEAYAPYSQFKVGAALLLENDEIITGNNQENKAYPSSMCAERVALYNYGAHSLHYKIKLLVVSGSGELLRKEDIFSPCGACRQVMAEYADVQGEPFEILLENQDGSFYLFDGIHHLLPLIFGNK
ncbi:MAG: cytidine deaminase [Brumimicrobium sp.]|nr:cytidine deaminase [Brumimicrobium sp.]MCO5268182.1 cytidine deaminase [Brumimicrobium sp.]